MIYSLLANVPSQVGNASASATGNSGTGGAVATANPSSTTQSSSMTVNWQINLVWTGSSGRPSSVSVTYSISDLAEQDWILAGYNPPDSNGYEDGNVSVGVASSSVSIGQTTVNQSDLYFDEPSAYGSTVTVTPDWQLNEMGGGWYALCTVASASFSASATYSKPAYSQGPNYGTTDYMTSSAYETFTITSAG